MNPTAVTKAIGLCLLVSSASAQAPEIIHYTFDNGDAMNSAVPGVGDGIFTSEISFPASDACMPGLKMESTGTLDVEVNTGWQMDLGLGDWSVGMFVTPQTVSTSLQYFFGSQSSSSTTTSFRCFTGGLAGDDGLFLRTLMGGDVALPGVLFPGMTSHVVFVHDSSIPEVRGYLNGVLMVSEPQIDPGPGITATAADFHLMSYTGAGSNTIDPGNGIDDFRFYRRAISDAEIMSWSMCKGAPSLPSFCDPADNNSTGQPTRLFGSFSGSPGTGLHLESTQGPPGQFGYMLVGSDSADPGLAVGQGHLCLSVQPGEIIGRYNIVGGVLNSVGQFDSSGVLQNIVGTSASGSGFDVPTTLPFTGSPTIMTGDTWHFQVWHRENGGNSNFSNGVTAMF